MTPQEIQAQLDLATAEHPQLVKECERLAYEATLDPTKEDAFLVSRGAITACADRIARLEMALERAREVAQQAVLAARAAANVARLENVARACAARDKHVVEMAEHLAKAAQAFKRAERAGQLAIESVPGDDAASLVLQHSGGHLLFRGGLDHLWQVELFKVSAPWIGLGSTKVVSRLLPGAQCPDQRLALQPDKAQSAAERVAEASGWWNAFLAGRAAPRLPNETVGPVYLVSQQTGEEILIEPARSEATPAPKIAPPPATGLPSGVAGSDPNRAVDQPPPLAGMDNPVGFNADGTPRVDPNAGHVLMPPRKMRMS